MTHPRAGWRGVGVLTRTLAVGVALGGMTLAWGGLVERHWYAVRHETLPVLRATAAARTDGSTPAGRSRLRVLLFADLHLLPRQRRRTAFLRRAVEEWDPDLVVSGGDNLEDAAAVDEVVAVHRDVIAGRLGVAVIGAHDVWAPQLTNPAGYLTGPSDGPPGPRLDTDRLIGGLEDAGWHVLDNARTVLHTPVGPVDVVGIGDAHRRLADVGAVDWTPAEGVALSLGVTHAPYSSVLRPMDEAGVDLALAGHTHGGQICVPFHGALVSNCDLPPRHAQGTSRQGERLLLHVTAGLGHSRYFPVRVARRPELSVLDLVPRDA